MASARVQFECDLPTGSTRYAPTPAPQRLPTGKSPLSTPPYVHAYNPGGDRLTEHAGATQLKTARRMEVPNTIGISDWELKGPTCCEQICLALRCSCWDDTRQYLYIRDNSSIEKNDTNVITSCCTCCCGVRDNVSVMYNDRAPYGPTRCRLSPFPLCCLLHSGQPQFRVEQGGYMCFCLKVNCCCRGKYVVVSPSEHLPCPCCCCTNRVSYCDNCCGTCGPISGNSRVFTVFRPQPKDADAFVAAANQVMMRDTQHFVAALHPLPGVAPGQRSSKAAQGEVLGQRLSKAAQGEVLVQLHKASQHEKLGLGLIENASGQVVVSYIHPGYVADKCKALLSADVLLEVNGEPVADLATALKLLNASLGTVELRLVRMDTACALNCAAHYMCMCMSCACACAHDTCTCTCYMHMHMCMCMCMLTHVHVHVHVHAPCTC